MRHAPTSSIRNFVHVSRNPETKKNTCPSVSGRFQGVFFAIHCARTYVWPEHHQILDTLRQHARKREGGDKICVALPEI